MASLFVKDPDSVLDYQFDWSSWLTGGDTIASHTVTVPAGITKDSDSATTTAVTVWLSGGTVDTDYEVTCEIVTVGGRTDQRTITIVVRER